MVLQAFEYEKREKTPHSLEEFFVATQGKFNHPLITGLVGELTKRRTAFETKDAGDTSAETNVSS